MAVLRFNINITSEQPERLIAFYRDVLRLPVDPEVGDGAFLVGGTSLLIDGHSETHGPTREPQRVLINFFVDDIAAEQTRLAAHGVQFIRDKGREWWGGVISTFRDPDGNYLQIIEYQPEAATSGTPA